MTDAKYLEKTVWATLKPSSIEGIGVFAIRSIPKGTLITDYSVHNIHDLRLMKLTADEMYELEEGIRSLILNRTSFPENTEIFRFYSPNYDACLQSFMNHSDDPNSDGIKALRDIEVGEEITEDYRKLTQTSPIHPFNKVHYSFIR